MNRACERCGFTHDPNDARPVGPLDPPMWQAEFLGAPPRMTRAQAERDMCDFRWAANLEPEPAPEPEYGPAQGHRLVDALLGALVAARAAGRHVVGH